MSLPTEIVDLIPESEAKDAFCEFAEVALDSSLDEGVLKDIPVIGIIMKAGSAVITIRDRLFIKKVAYFLNALDKIPNQRRLQFVEKELKDESSRRKTGEKLILIIDKQDDFDKTSLIGYIFKSHIEAKITREEFDLLSHSVSNAYMPDLEYLPKLRGDNIGNDPYGAALMGIGLAEARIHIREATWEDSPPPEIAYSLNSLGAKLSEIMKEYKNEANK